MRIARPLADPYRILGVARAADSDQIKAAHRRLAKEFHPDGSTGNEQRFLAVQEAYQLLIDQRRRREWDERHAPGPIRANAAPSRPAAASTKAAGPSSAGATAPDQGTARPRRPARDGRSRSHTWSAESVPWWEDFRPGQRGAGSADATRDAAGPADPEPSSEGTATKPVMDFDVFNRSSGAAWSMAARRHFRKGDDDLPSRGTWRYRGTQVVTGAEARKVVAEEAEAEAARVRRATARVRPDSTDDHPND